MGHRITEYYIGNILQDYRPVAPNPDTLILLDDKAIIGYEDTVDRTNCVFKVFTVPISEAERIADYDEYTACNP